MEELSEKNRLAKPVLLVNISKFLVTAQIKMDFVCFSLSRSLRQKPHFLFLQNLQADPASDSREKIEAF